MMGLYVSAAPTAAAAAAELLLAMGLSAFPSVNACCAAPAAAAEIVRLSC